MSKTILPVLLVVLLASACSPIIANHGNMLKEASIQEIVPQTSTRVDVQDKWGPPSTVSAFDPNTWYYIGEKTSRKGIFAPEVDKREIIKVTFNDDDTVKEIVNLDEKEGKEIKLVDEKTPTAGKEFTAFQQFVGNLGKFNSSQTKRSSPGAGNY